MFDSENQLKPAHLPLECHHGSPPSTCPHNDPQARYRCPTADEIKYRMTRVAIDAIDIYLVESSTAINFWVIYLLMIHIYFMILILIISNDLTMVEKINF